jgi:hypothetical protein
MLKYYPKTTAKHMMHTRDLKDVNNVNNEILIIKPSGNRGFAGNGIYIVTNNQELSIAKQILSKSNFENVIVSSYLQNCLLFKNKKFHLRMYMLVTTFTKVAKLFKRGRILTAKEDYKLIDFGNPDIHDTHIKSTIGEYYFPEDFPGSKKDKIIVYNQMKSIVKKAGSIILKKEKVIQPFDDTQYAFEVFGVDFLIDTNMNVILLEINEKVSNRQIGKAYNEVDPINGPFTDKFTKFNKQLYKWMFKYAINPIFFKA